MTINKHLRYTHPLNNVFSEGLNTDSKLKYNIYCNFINEKLLDMNETKVYLSKCNNKVITEASLLCTMSIPLIIDSPSLLPLFI